MALVFQNIPVMATNLSPMLKVQTVNCSYSDTEQDIEIAISCENNPGIISIKLLLEYPTEYLSLIDITGCVDGLEAGHDMKNLNKMPFVLDWHDDTANGNYVFNGNLCILKFKLKAGTPIGSYPIKISYDNEKEHIVNYDLKTVDFEITNGSIIVEKGNPYTKSQITNSVCKVNVYNLEGNYKVIFAGYDETGKVLKHVETKPYVLSPVDFNIPDTVVTAKVMIWDNMNTITPITNVETLQIQQ